MNYLNLETNDMRAPEFAMASAQERGAWLSLMLHCVATENGGVMTGAGAWTERNWLALCGLTFEDLSCDREGNPKGNVSLWYWIGNDLHLWGFPHEKLAQVNAGREGGKKGGRPKKVENPLNNPPENPGETPLETLPKTLSEPSPKPERKGKEGKEKGIEDKGIENKAPHKPGRESDFCFEMLVQIEGAVLSELTKPLRGQINAALRSIREVMPDVTPDEISRRASAYRAKWPDVHLTANALAKHWAIFGEKKEGPPPAEGAETPSAPPPAALPDWPWRAVAKLVLEWLAVPSTDEEWRNLELPVQRSVYKAWKTLSPEAQERLREVTL